MDGPAWMEQKKFLLQHLRKIGFGHDSMENLIIAEVDDLVLNIKRECIVCLLEKCFRLDRKNIHAWFFVFRMENLFK